MTCLKAEALAVGGGNKRAGSWGIQKPALYAVLVLGTR
jgi:hypothetical protein